VNAVRRSQVLMMAVVIMWTLVELIASTLLNHYTAYQVVWTRYGVHLLLMLAWWGWRDPLSLLRTRRPGVQWSRSSLMFVMPVSWYLATKAGVRESTTMLIFWFSPLVVLALARLSLGETVPRSAWMLCLAGALGGTVCFAPTPLPRPLWLAAAPLGMGLSFAIYVVMTRTLRDEPVRVNLFYTALGVFLLLTPIVPFEWVTPNAADLAKLALVGTVGYFALFALDRLVAASTVSASAPLFHLQLALGVAFSVALGHAPIDARHLAVLALAGAPLLLLLRPVVPQPAPVLAPPAEAAR
jgi:drug/metabolite transporter (DMT)-like permease